MSDLISRKALIQEMEKKYDVAKETGMYPTGLEEAFIITEGIIQKQPTAYDVDRVVEQLESFPVLEVTQYPLHGKYLKKDSVLKIVKGGGVDE